MLEINLILDLNVYLKIELELPKNNKEIYFCFFFSPLNFRYLYMNRKNQVTVDFFLSFLTLIQQKNNWRKNKRVENEFSSLNATFSLFHCLTFVI